MDIKDLTGLSKPLTKLIEVISKGIGAISQPYLIKKTADAKAYEMRKIAAAIGENQEALKTIKYDDSKLSLQSIDNSVLEQNKLEDRVDNRLNFIENKRQHNIESITQKSVVYIENESVSEASNENVDDDWTTRFFNYAQDISDVDMQELWARILAGEVLRPGKFSLRTLELIRNLSRKEADTFTRIANLTINSFGRPCIFKGKDDTDFLGKYGCNFEDRLLLVELGLLQPDSFISRTIPSNDTEEPVNYYHDSGNILIKQTLQPKSKEFLIPIYRYSLIGEQLLNIIITNPNMDYLKAYSEFISNDKSSVEYSYILERQKNGAYQHSLPWKKF